MIGDGELKERPDFLQQVGAVGKLKVLTQILQSKVCKLVEFSEEQNQAFRHLTRAIATEWSVGVLTCRQFSILFFDHAPQSGTGNPNERVQALLLNRLQVLDDVIREVVLVVPNGHLNELVEVECLEIEALEKR